MAESSDHFETLLTRARTGDAAALGELAREYEPSLRLVARKLLGPQLRPYLDSIDLVQSVHKSLLIGIRNNKFDITTPDRMCALALTILRRKISRQWRRAKRQDRWDNSAGDSSAQPFAALRSTETDPQSEAELRDALEHICQYLDQYQQSILEKRTQGWKLVDIATEYGVDPDVFRAYWSRVTRRLRDQGVLTDLV